MHKHPRGTPAITYIRIAALFALCLLAVVAAGCRDNQTASVTSHKAASLTDLPPAIMNQPDELLPPSVAEGVAGSIYIPTLFHRFAASKCNATGGPPVEQGVVDGSLIAWQPLTLRLTGPAAAESDDPATNGAPNPFLDYRLQVAFLGPSGQLYNVPGFFNGDGQGGGAGDVWMARFSPDEPGRWRYCVSFHSGSGVAVELDPLLGEAKAPDGVSGIFDVTPVDPHAPGFLRWGGLEYVGEHYLKFRDGPYWLKGGVDSPENFLAYAGFMNTADQDDAGSEFLHTYGPHTVDWRAGDPELAGAFDSGHGIIGALNYLSAQGINSIYFLPMNLGGDGRDTYPFLSPNDPTHYDIGKLEQWLTVLDHAQQRGIALHIVLNETEQDNRRWLDDEQLGQARKLYYRELVARFGHLLAIKWNLSEEIVFTREEVLSFSTYLRALDWAAHPIAVHNPTTWFHVYDELLGQPTIEATAFQYDIDQIGELVERFRLSSGQAGRPWIIEADENNPAGIGLTADNAGQLRKSALYDVYFSGGAGIEWYLGYHDLPLGGDLNLEDFRTREAMWGYMRHARTFLERYLPFRQMLPADDLLIDEAQDFGGGEVLALPGAYYAVYLPSGAATGRLAVPADQTYHVLWYDPRTGNFKGTPQRQTPIDEYLTLGTPPDNPAADWVVLVRAVGAPPPAADPVEPYP